MLGGENETGSHLRRCFGAAFPLNRQNTERPVECVNTRRALSNVVSADPSTLARGLVRLRNSTNVGGVGANEPGVMALCAGSVSFCSCASPRSRLPPRQPPRFLPPDSSFAARLS